MIVYVCSPSRGEPPYTQTKLGRNLRKTAAYCAEVSKAGHTPIAPHLYFHGFLSDMRDKERERGMQMGETLLGVCNAMWVYGKSHSEGMKRDIALAERLGVPITYK